MNEIDETIDDFCRICAKKTNQVQNLFEDTYNGIVLAEMLKHCFKRHISRTDGLPVNICTNCKANLITTYEFHHLCECSEQYLLERFPLSGEFKPFRRAEVNSSAEIKTEDDYGLVQIDIDENVDFNAKCDEQPALISELVCVEENFDVNSIIVDENTAPEPLDLQAKGRSSTRTAQLHKNRLKSDETIYECYECKRNFHQFNELRHHMSDHDNTQKPFACTICNMRFVHLNSWFRHRSRHTKNIHDCEYCSESFNTLTALKHHIQEMHKEQLNAYKCTQCSEKFALHFQLVWHNEWHKKAKQIVCTTCDAVFFNERKLKAHIRDNHASHLCAECGKSFKTIHLLASHQMLHTTEKPFGCDLCPSRFKWKAALKTHMLVHTGQKQHICDICGASFTTKGSMKKHKRIHTGDRRYQCETCSRAFYSNDHLKRHKRTHTGERPYLCSYCPRSFSQSNDLTKHIRSHVGQNMYRCHCGESFRLQTELRKHSYTHYNKDESDALKSEETH